MNFKNWIHHPRFWSISAVGVLFALTLLWWLWPQTVQQIGSPVAPILVEAEKSTLGKISRRVTTNGSLTAAESVTLFPEFDGRIAEIFFEQGQKVAKDTVLVRLDDSLYQAQLQEAQAKLTVAANQYKRAKQLFDKKFAPQAAVEKAQAEMDVARSEVQIASVRVAQALIKAPFDGVMGLRDVSIGSTVARNQEISSIVSMDNLYVDFPIPDSFMRHLQVGDVVDVTVEGFDILPMAATIVAFDSKANPSTHTVMVRAMLPNPTHKMKPGQFARVSLNLGQEENAILIPVSALEKEGDDYFVFVVVDHVAIVSGVDVGLREGNIVQVKQGVKEGDFVVTAGQVKLMGRDGVPVRILSEEEKFNEDKKDSLAKNNPDTALPSSGQSWIGRLWTFVRSAFPFLFSAEKKG